MSFACQLKNAIVRNVYERIAKELRKNENVRCRLESYERVTNSLRNAYETIRNSLVTFSCVHFTKFCKLGPSFLQWTGVWPRAKEMEVSAAPWAFRLCEGQGRRSIWDKGTHPPNIWTGGDIIMNVPLNISRVISATFYPCNIFLISS